MATTMDATELARWTRFAAKGGIGKCTAVQDCVAESPEDLMFLKDDEITVLMQLSNQPGYYLGYCEGVVGRFQGDHVRFHGKLKRPIMTKRSSASAMSVASSPVPSVTPSPRLPLSPLVGSSPSTGQLLDRDSKALSDPFDLELDAPPKPRRSEDAASQSESDGGRRRLSRGADDLPGFEMFLPRSRSGSRSRPTSRGQREDEKKTRRQTRTMTPPQLQLVSGRKDSLDVPPSPLPQSPVSQAKPASPVSPASQGKPSLPASPVKLQPEKPEEVQIKIDGEEEQVEEKPPVSSSPEPLQPEPFRLDSPMKYESSLYDAGSMRSSIYSTHSYRSSVFGGGNGLSAAASDAFARISQAESDDGGIGMGIGLSMLQDMADDEDEETGDVGVAPPTPRPPESNEGVEQKKDEAKEENVEGERGKDAEEEDEEEYDEDDDGESYWDGADIYDNYRYSRFSMMTKNSRRKSRFSVVSRYSFVGGGPKKAPPVPLDAEVRLRTDSLNSTGTSDAPKDKNGDERGKKHIPPPLNLVKPGPSSSTVLLSPAQALSPASTSNRSTAELSAGGSDQLSPLLHTSFASPRSSSSRNTSFGTDEGDRSPESSTANFVPVGPSANSNGAASALRQRLEHERSASPTPLPCPMLDREVSPSGADLQQHNTEGPGKGIVVEDNESVNVTIVPAEDSGSSTQNHENANDHATRDSVQSAVSTGTTDSTATFMSDMSDVSGVMRRIERDLASVTAFSGTASSPNIGSTLADVDGTPTPTLTNFSVGTTQPLRVQGRAASRSTPLPSPVPPPSPDPNPNRAQQQQAPPPSPSPSPKQQELPVQQNAKLSQGPQLLRPEQALFPPHPNAPRPNPAVLSGQRASTYGMPPVHDPPLQAAPSSPAAPGLSGSSLEATLRAASAARVGPAGIPHRATIYGKTVVDLASADGPVAIVWSLSPFPPDPPSRQGSPAPGAHVPRRAATAGASPLSQSFGAIASNPPSPSLNQSSVPVTSPPRSASPAHATFPRSASPSVSDNPTPTASSNARSTPNVLLRPNFQPRVGVARPRSRSFSDFSREISVKPVLKERASEEGSKPMRVASVQSLKEAAGMPRSNNTNVNGQNGQQVRQSSAVNGSPPKRSAHTPSPLSRPGNNAVLNTPRATPFSKGTPSSPLARSFLSSNQIHLPGQVEQPPDTEKGNGGLRQLAIPAARIQGVRQVASVDNFKVGRSDQPLIGPSRSMLQPIRRNSETATGPSASTSGVAADPSTAPPTAVSRNVATSPPLPQRLRRLSSPSSKRHERSTSQQSQTSSGELRSATSPPPNTSSSSTPSPVQRTSSIKSKLSLSHLRIRHASGKDSLDTQNTQTPSPSTAPQTPVFDYDNQPETVQVQDAEFEMIRPAMLRISAEPVSDDAAMGSDERPSLQQDSIIESPVSGSGRSMSVLSSQPSTTTDSMTEQGHTRLMKPAEEAAAHRARELKWMSLMSSVPASQARKSKKIRRLLLEGVPSSVRYLVWSHLADSKAKRIPGVYGQLGKRGRVAASEVIERDAARCFSDQPHLQDPKGPLVGLLQTYLTMVPDVEYQTSLTLVAGHVLLQSPEEDAFWIFTSMMDWHLRAYFSSKSVQMDADALVFGKVVELIHPQVAKKLFSDLSISSAEIFRTWFPSLFATALPQDYVNRIWDVYLYEGPPFLFRVALAILACCRSAIESSSNRATVLAFLNRPETLSLLSDSPEEFINIALAVKLKDDDIRKYRGKVEAELRRRTQSVHRSNGPRLVSSISLPRAGPMPAPPV